MLMLAEQTLLLAASVQCPCIVRLCFSVSAKTEKLLYQKLMW